ncbi:DUF1302 family protein [Ferrimonas aestuarii]|uniref:Porin n=1 Tax=Ferrimonas aestuarii TaxID=2569539 RepID=A0A4U1BNJ4_9GAMM|nr:DUF1302 family protein [Ferrimonas aestuarii]TKB55527.1 hypothetical protein FCL42_10100 [Ferrimonas aestuarii]
MNAFLPLGLVLLTLPSIAMAESSPRLDKTANDGWAQTNPEDDWEQWEQEWSEPQTSPWRTITGFGELGGGSRLQSQPSLSNDHLGSSTLGMGRLRLEGGYDGESATISFRGELGYDWVTEDAISEFRELVVTSSISSSTALKLGRQVLTWGTGDYLFLNDLFPKDWQAFFAGEDDEYLKAPINAIKLNQRLGSAYLDLVYMPEFEADNALIGERFYFFSPNQGQLVAPNYRAEEPNDDAGALRLYGDWQGVELALYGYWGYTGQPVATTPQGEAVHSRLNAYGISALSPVGRGLVNMELSYHQSLGDNSPCNQNVCYPNLDNDNQEPPQGDVPEDKVLALIGYQQEISTGLTLSLQYYLEHIRHYQRYVDAQTHPEYASDQNRQLLTLRLGYLALQDRLSLNFFGFYSPTDEDFYLKPSISYRLSDQWQLSAGVNWMDGKQQHTFFGQLEENSNGWMRLRYYY